jgi:hypothetical protein
MALPYTIGGPLTLQARMHKAAEQIREVINPKLMLRVVIVRDVASDAYVANIRMLNQDWTQHSVLPVMIPNDEIDSFPDDTVMTQLTILAG